VRAFGGIAVALLFAVAGCGGGGSYAGSGGTTRAQETKSEDHGAVADEIAASVGKQSYCYYIGSMVYRGSRADLYQCELGATGNAACYVRPNAKPVNVDKLLSRPEVIKTLEGSDIDQLACTS
jgi:hypothetical protein